MDESRDQLFETIKALTELPGPVGHEQPVQDWLVSRWGTFAKQVTRTPVGNVLAHVAGEGQRLVLVAHADEICLMGKSVTDEGFYHFWPYYNDTVGHPPRWFTPINQPALIVTPRGNIDGVFATASGHVVGGRNSTKQHAEWNDWFVDIGARSRDEAEEMGLRPGCPIIWNPATRRIGRNLVGKAMDDRVALAIATIVGERLASEGSLAYEVWLASTVQEENGLIGAASLVDEQRFQRAIALDVGLTGDIPGTDPRDFPAKLGHGPVVVYHDGSCAYSPGFSDEIVSAATAANLPVQQAVFQHYGSDGAALIRRGVETALIAYPTRYTHSPIETVDETDVMACCDLLTALLRNQAD